MPRDVVAESIRELDGEKIPTVARNSLPTIRYAPEIGQVIVEAANLDRITLRNDENEEIPLGRSCSEATPWKPLQSFLPPQLRICWSDTPESISREVYDPKAFQGIWFNGRSGRLHCGTPQPGKWYLLVRGEALHVKNAERLDLDWWSLTGEPWTALSVEIEAAQPFTIELDGTSYTIPAAKRSNPRPTLETPLRCARVLESAWAGEPVDVFADPPVIANPIDGAIRVQAQRLDADCEIECMVPANGKETMRLLEPGIYRLRFIPLSGWRAYPQPLALVAYVPGFNVHTPEYDSSYESFQLRVRLPSFGNVDVEGPYQSNSVSGGLDIVGDTVQTSIPLRWRWALPLTGFAFEWREPIAGIRWRLNTAEGAQSWTREPVEILRQDTFAKQARLEIQVPKNWQVALPNGKTWVPIVSDAVVDHYRYDLKGFDHEVATVMVQQIPYDMVSLSTRPQLSQFEVVEEGEGLLGAWTGRTYRENSILVWDLRAPWTAPFTVPVPESRESECLLIPADPNCAWLISMGSFRSRGFTKRWDLGWNAEHHEWEIIWSANATNSSALHFYRILAKLIRQYRDGRKPDWSECLLDPKLDAESSDNALVGAWIKTIPDSQTDLRREVSRWWRRSGPKLSDNDPSELREQILDDLLAGIHPFANGEPHLLTSKPPDVNDDLRRCYPLHFFEALHSLRKPLKDYFAIGRGGNGEDLLPRLKDIASFVFDYLGAVDLQQLQLSLPLTNTVHARPEQHRGWRHLLRVYSRPNSGKKKRFKERLGLEPISLVLESPLNREYAHWRIDLQHRIWGWNCRSGAGVPLTHAQPAALSVIPPSADDLMTIAKQAFPEDTLCEGLEIPDVRAPWELIDAGSALGVFLRRYRDLTQPGERLLVLAGEKVPTWPDWPVSEITDRLWRFAWVERLYCTRSGESSWLSYAPEIPAILRQALNQNALATNRMLTLVEWLRVTLEHGGIGFAAKYYVSSTTPAELVEKE